MGKRKLFLNLTNENEFRYYDDTTRVDIDFNSYESLKTALSDFSKFADYDEYFERRKEFEKIESEFYYADSNGNEVDISAVSDEEFEKIDTVLRNPKEAKKILAKKMKKFDLIYDDMLKENYDFYMLRVCPDAVISSDELKKVLTLLKDKIELLDIASLGLVDVIELLKNVDIDDSVEIVTKYNHHDFTNRTELLELSDYLDNIKNLIARYDLSPLEICILVNDLLLDREYKKAETDNDVLKGDKIIAEDAEKIANSRSITKVFKNEEIVCAGFSNLYSAILDLVGIDSVTVKYVPLAGRIGHMSNVVYLNDNKYGVHGLFEIDTTWSRLKNADGTYNFKNSLENYIHFARPIQKAFEFKEKNGFVADCKGLDFNNFRNSATRCIKLFNLKAPFNVMESELKLICNPAKSLATKIGTNTVLESKIDMLELYIKERHIVDSEVLPVLSKIYKEIYDSNLSPFSFKDALFRVKLIEHSIDKDKYPLDEQILNSAYNSRMGTDENKLLSIIFGEEFGFDLTDKQKLDIARAELISVLHKVAKDNVDKSPTEYIKK